MKLGDDQSESWSPKVGLGQGRRLSSTFFNVCSISMTLWDYVEKSVVYVDDGCSVICGRIHDKLNENIRAACEEKVEWHELKLLDPIAKNFMSDEISAM